MTLTEQVFRKMGYHTMKDDDGNPYCWLNAEGRNDIGIIPADDNGWCNRLPPIDSQWEVCAKYLVPFMRERPGKWEWEVFINMLGQKMFIWKDIQAVGIIIKDDNIAEAACEAFMEVEL